MAIAESAEPTETELQDDDNIESLVMSLKDASASAAFIALHMFLEENKCKGLKLPSTLVWNRWLQRLGQATFVNFLAQTFLL
jgi:hypothetical protein